MNTIKWGILSTAKIGRKKVIPALKQAGHCEVKAIASRNESRAKECAEALDIPSYYGSYEALLDQDDINAVYIPLPNNLHVHWSIEALRAGKHVLCEKPIGMNADEAVKLIEEAKKHPNLRVMEGFMYRHHPQWKYIRDQVNNQEIGNLRTIKTFFSYYKDDPENIRNRSETGGGGMMDIGCYALSVSRYLFDQEPQQVVSSVDFDPNFKVDRLASGILQFEEGTATFTCSTQAAPQQSVEIYGTDALLEVEMPFNPPLNGKTHVYKHTEEGSEEIEFGPCNQFALQAEHFARSILNDEPLSFPLTDAAHNMNVIDAVFESEQKHKWVSLKELDL